MLKFSVAPVAILLALLACGPVGADPPQAFLQFDGTTTNYVEVPNSGLPDSADFSVSPAGLTVAAWIRPDTLTFDNAQVGGDPLNPYLHWLGKGEGAGPAGQQEWTFRIYSVNPDCTDPRPTVCRRNRISFYLFNPSGGRGCGVAFQDDLEAGQWVHVVAVVDQGNQAMSIYKNGGVPTGDGDFLPRATFSYDGLITPTPGAALLRMGTRDLVSFFQGALAHVRIWNRPLSGIDVHAVFDSDSVPQDGLVAEYLLNDGAGTRAGDTADGHDGVVQGALGWGFDTNPAMNTPTGTNHTGC
jgi:hypothetical protein